MESAAIKGWPDSPSGKLAVLSLSVVCLEPANIDMVHILLLILATCY